MKQTRLLRTLLAAVCLFVGTSAWGDGTKRILNSVDYESATASDWAGPNITNTLESGHATYGKYVKVIPNGTGNRSAYKSVAFAYTAGSGKTASDMATTGYVIEFDMLMSGGNTKDRSESQFIIPTTGPNLATNTTYSGTDYIFALSQKQRDAASRITGWYINDLTNTTDKTVALDYSTWYHYKIVVTGTSVTYTITHNNQTDATGSKTVETLPTITGFFGCLGRGSGEIRFDNLEIYDYTEDIVVAAPTFSFNKVDGANRNYTITNSNGSGTLYYTTTPAEEAPAKGDAAYSSTTDLSKTLDYGTSGNYYAYVLHSNGTTSSVITTQTVTAGELTLAAPVFKIEDMVLAEDGYYYPKVSFTSTNSLEGNPVPTYNIESPYTFNGIGYIDVTASAKGYTSSTSRYTVSTRYSKSKTIDFGALTANDFDANVWSSGTGAPRDYWTNRAAAIPADVPMRYLTTKSAEAGNPDNSSVVSGITISNYNQRAPEFCIGYGMYTPYAAISGSGNNMTFSVNDATADDIIVYNGWNDYGSGTFNTVQTGEKSFNLYRYDTMLRTINVYSPANVTIIGALDKTTALNDWVMSEGIVLPNNTAKTVTFKNHGTSSQNYYNFLLRLTYNDTFFEHAKADWATFDGKGEFPYAYSCSTDGGNTYGGSTDFATFKTDMENSDVVLNMSHVDGVLYINGTMSAGENVYYYNYKYGDGTNTENFQVNLTVDKAWIEIVSVEDATPSTTPAHPSYVAVTLGSNGYTTYANNVYPLDLTNATAYKASVSGDKVNFTLFEQAVPASTGMLVGGNGTVNLPIADASTAVEGNEFLVNTSGAVFNAEENTKYYAMLKDSNPLAFGTFNPSSLAFPETKAYLKVANNAGAKALTAFFGGDVTGISKVENGVKTSDNTVYNLAGQRVIKPTKGLYIVNGKKVIVKIYE